MLTGPILPCLMLRKNLANRRSGGPLRHCDHGSVHIRVTRAIRERMIVFATLTQSRQRLEASNHTDMHAVRLILILELSAEFRPRTAWIWRTKA
jgi:hypothetical protein